MEMNKETANEGRKEGRKEGRREGRKQEQNSLIEQIDVILHLAFL